MMGKILIIEDEPHISKLVAYLLQKGGYAVVQAVDGKKGIAAAKKELPDLILLDVMMPGMDGFTVAKALREDKRTSAIPILMLSSAAQYKDRIKGISSGATDYLTKPFEPKELLQKVSQHL
ncbi:MAG: hypothetical protein A2Z88_00765 [Omnitrophica WOR_2 bacterium GWA2_47_8]|nr:MAG: hypothetical protein A2Z88_00765 [Omnitrophica WOR_2 bacterium GWA2_47_8]